VYKLSESFNQTIVNAL